jgi:hypothetical protein
MKKLTFIVFFILSSSFFIPAFGQIYIADSCRVIFFSSTEMEDIKAVNTISKPVMNFADSAIQISISIRDFEFERSLMQEHFNEDYMESDKYPHAVFKGKINQKVDYKKSGVTQVTVTGAMNMHGVIKTITIPGTITVKDGLVFLWAKFNVTMADYNVRVPEVLGNNLADFVTVTLTATMKPYKN